MFLLLVIFFVILLFNLILKCVPVISRIVSYYLVMSNIVFWQYVTYNCIHHVLSPTYWSDSADKPCYISRNRDVGLRWINKPLGVNQEVFYL